MFGALNPVTTIFGIVFGLAKVAALFFPESQHVAEVVEAVAGTGGLVSAVDQGKVLKNAHVEKREAAVPPSL